MEEKLKNLITRFDEHREEYTSAKYDESNTRSDFIDKFFECLGWDVRNDKGYAEDYRDVVREDSIHIEGKPKAPDYSFRIGGVRKFFVEAKKPSINIKKDIGAAFQLRRYAYTAKLPLSILTDFEEFAVYDTRIKPKANDKASVARVFYCKYDEYEKHWDFIKSTFSREAILKGSFDKYVKSNKKKHGTSEVDREFLLQIEGWRKELARNIALRNKNLSIHELNFAVQKIIDRIIFLRIAEDRGMEDYATLRKMTENKDKKYHIYKELVKYFRHADKKYNSGLFDFDSDRITPNLTIDHKIFNSIIKDLYYPNSPYEFSVLPIEILGHIYEQFLGRTIRLTPAHHAKIEYKPEVRKAGGVYYTPQYIVDYIVKNTLGEKLKGKTPGQIKELTVLDPACGSGSFLITAYDHLMKYYLSYYSDETRSEKALKDNIIYAVDEKSYRLTIDAKRDILTRHIYGVDIDSQAVEVTKLSLLLKLMENERLETTQHLFTRMEMKLLPDLSDNIKCGNSLIGSDFFEGQQIDMFDDELIRKINAFDWEDEFPKIFSRGGFDVVIGNPPYVQIQKLDSEVEKSILEHAGYETFSRTADIYCLFYEKGIQVMKDKAIMGFITSNKWMRAGYGSKIRDYLSKNINPLKIIDFSGYKIFQNATVDTMILIFEKSSNKEETLSLQVGDEFNSSVNLAEYFKKNAFQSSFNTSSGWIITSDKEQQIIDKIKEHGTPLKEWDIKINYGIKTGLDKAFIINGEKREELIAEDPKSDEIIKPLLRGRDIKRYNYKQISWLINTGYDLDISSKYLAIFSYLKSFKKQAIKRYDQGKNWWNLRSCSYYNEFEKEKLVWAGVGGNRFEMTLANPGIYLKEPANLITGEHLRYLLGLINSNLIDFYYSSIKTKIGSGTRFYVKDFKKIPIILADKNTQSKISSIVDIIIDKKDNCQSTELEEKTIDRMVYELYNLTPEEIEIVEGK